MPILASLHWQPVYFRIDFKILIITFKAQIGLAPQYIDECLISNEPEILLWILVRDSKIEIENQERLGLCYQSPVTLE